MGTMRTITAAILATTVFTAQAQVIASCGPLAGYSYHHGDESVGVKPEWSQDSINGATIFMGTDAVEDVILKSSLGSETWTRSASDYGAIIRSIHHDETGSLRHVVVIWGPVAEVYALDLERKTLSLVSQKSGAIRLTTAFVGKCE